MTAPPTPAQLDRAALTVAAASPDEEGLARELSSLRRGRPAHFLWSLGSWEVVEGGVATTSPRACVWLRVVGRAVTVTAHPPALLGARCAVRFAGAYERVALLAAEVQALLGEVRA